MKNKILPSAFDRGTIYDYCYQPEAGDSGAGEWKNWIDFINKDEIDRFPKDSVVQTLIVTTPETIKYGKMQEMFINNKIKSLFVGPTGTGKTVYIQDVLHNVLVESEWLIIEMGFSA